MTTGSDWRILCLGSATAVLLLSAAAAFGILSGETAVRDALWAWRTPPVLELARWVNYGGTWHVLVPGALLLLILSRGARGRWWLWCAVLVAAPVISDGWQEVIERPRPRGLAFGFPSGHATSSATFAVMLVYLVGRTRLPARWRLVVQLLGLVNMVAVGAARIVLRAHWPADVAVGFALGSACAAAAIWWDTAHPLPNPVPTAAELRVTHRMPCLVVAALLLLGPCPGAVAARLHPLSELARGLAGDRIAVVSSRLPGGGDAPASPKLAEPRTSDFGASALVPNRRERLDWP